MRNTVSFIFCCMLLVACNEAPPVITGNWSNGGGQELHFSDNENVKWVFNLPNGDTLKADTFLMTYAYDTTVSPSTFDLKGFGKGPLSGKTLYGILQMESDSSFLFHSNPGEADGDAEKIRPFGFDPIRTQTFTRID